LGVIFVTSGLGKIPYQGEFLGVLASIPFVPGMLSYSVVISLPWVELILGLLLIVGVAARLVAGCCLALVVAFIANNIWMVTHGMGRESCGCFGGLEVFFGYLAPVQTLYVDAVMLVLAVVVLCYYRGGFLDPRPWFLRKGEAGEENEGG
jgi:uncharacterized membrane protein YphA (DoxX/SURF4 family)